MEPKDVKSALNTRVKLKGSSADYLFTGYILRRAGDKFIHQAELQDLNCGHCIVIAKLEDVEESKNETNL